MASPLFTPSPTVLVVDDEDLVRSYMERTLVEANYRVVTASNGLEAMGVLATTQDIAAVVTDIQMPKFDGIDVAAFVRTLPGPPPVLFVSGATREAHIPGPFLQKPFKPEDLARAVRELLPTGC